MKPVDLVKSLDNLFREFDKIIEKHQIEKIKTIGDAYMAAGGVPLRDKENPVNCHLRLTILSGVFFDCFLENNGN